MSTEEKNPILSKVEGEEITEVPSPRPQVPVVDYSVKNFYDHLGLKTDASEETLKSTANELLKKYNPVTNPDEISKYQKVLRSDRILNNATLKKYYDEFGSISILICEFFQHYYPNIVEEKPNSFLMKMLFLSFFIVVLMIISIFTLVIRYLRYFEAPFFVAFIPSILIVVIYIIMILVKHKNEMKYITSEGEKKEKSKQEIKMSNCISIVKCILLLLFQYALIKYFDNEEKSCFYCRCIPYILFEALVLYQDFAKFKIGVEGINTGKDVDSILLRGNTYVKYLIGINNSKCSMNKEGKKGACASCSIGLLALNIFKTDVLRLIQNILFFIAFNSNPPYYIVFFIPSYLMAIVSIGEIIIQKKIGYSRGTNESLISYFWSLWYVLICFDLVFTFFSLDVKTVDFVTHIILFIVELALLGGLLLGILPFIPVMEFKLKHDETDVPL
ncbi:hypothetical protein BCR36DRAFT_406092 [Piromyces finnis]|uniref:J domain-containing protein n=1 Tax=Piromyces finnis TaxID=1754191 RepID=A0A1Y1V1F6_9FUNG|nr:hypothetical protein BCR36DRAFT_406092 [Piromyces finnis]|eukprot:ORX45182.1 hypothetical protein BCR36DRAFT_406092 [Piromyces finnis]